MNRQRLIIAVAAVVVLILAGFLAWNRYHEDAAPVSAVSEAPVPAPPTVEEPSRPDLSTAEAPSPVEPPPPVPAEPATEPQPSETAAADAQVQEPASPADDEPASEGETLAELPGEPAIVAPPAPGADQTELPVSTEEEGATTPDEEAAAAAPEPEPPAGPSFDALRVNEGGDMIVAGRADPGAEVVIRAGEEEIGRGVAEPDGSFVVLSDKPLDPGEYTVGIEATDPGEAEPDLSDDVVVLVVPERGQTIAGEAATGETGGALALLTPRESSEPTRVLQAPPAPVAPTADLPPVPIAPGQRAEVTIEVVDYDADGNVLVSGSAPAGGLLRLYFDNTLASEAYAGQDGRYTLRPIALIMPGRYTLRVDLVDAGGRVIARAETPFQRTSPEELQLAEGRIIVQPGNSLWRIARNVYGRGVLYTVIFDANRTQIRDPDLIYPGQVFTVPGEPG